MQIKFDGKAFAEILDNIDKAAGSLDEAAEKALKAAFTEVTPGIQSAIAPHHRSGKTERSLYTAGEVKQEGGVLTVDYGFDIQNGGLASIFLMYGTPKMAKDSNLFNAIVGTRAKKTIKQAEEKALKEVLIKYLGG